jgi:hypothetical protein
LVDADHGGDERLGERCRRDHGQGGAETGGGEPAVKTGEPGRVIDVAAGGRRGDGGGDGAGSAAGDQRAAAESQDVTAGVADNAAALGRCCRPGQGEPKRQGVGPRPERPFFVQELMRVIPYYSQRLTVKPGISGWAQICYPYGSSARDALEKLQYDLYYIKNMSLLFDLTIILRTIRVVLFQQGAR